jgi:hypothetical protein
MLKMRAGTLLARGKNTLSVDFSDPIIEFSRQDISGEQFRFSLNCGAES